MRRSLQAFHHFFVQDITSKELLNSINFSSVTVSGDTRFDRVSKLLSQENTPDFISDFKNNQYTVVAGSTWKEDEELLVNYIINKASAKEKFIIAPHNIKKDAILKLQEALHNKAILFSEKEGKKLSEYKVLIIDTIGILTKIYPAADAAYVGGGLRTGLHNILEPATFGIPIVIGNQYKKFKEAIDLVALKGCISISNQEEFSSIFIKLTTMKIIEKRLGNEQTIHSTESWGNKINYELLKNNIINMDFIFEPWPWYVGGPLIAISLLLYFYFGKNFGASTNFETLCTMAGAGRVSAYFKKDWKNVILLYYL